MAFIYSMVDTWNAIGTTFNSIYMNISNGAGGAPVGAAASRAFRLDANGTRIFDVDITGLTNCVGGVTSAGGMRATSGGINIDLGWNVGVLSVSSDNALAYLAWGSSLDVRLYRDAANILAQRNGTTAQEFRLYNTYTDASNYERLRIQWGSNQASIYTESAGSGTSRKLQVFGNSVLELGGGYSVQWQITAVGHMLALTDNTHDIGASGATRPRTGYFGTGLTVGTNGVRGTTTFWEVGAAGNFSFSTRSFLSSSADGLLELFNAAGTGFTRLNFGGVTNAFGAVARDTVGIKFVLADNSAGTWSKDGVMTVASLPTPASAGAGAHLFVTDSLAPAFGVTIAAGGAVNSPVYSDGTNWRAG